MANNSTGDFSHGLVALRVTSGCRLAPAWSQPVGPDPAILSPPAVANGVVYLATGFGREVHAFEAASGRPLWASGNLGGAIHGGPIVAGGRLFVAGWDARLRAFSPA